MLVYEWSCHSLYFEGGVGPSSFSLVLGHLELETDYPVGTLRFVSGVFWLGDAVRGKVEVPVAPVRPYRFPRDVRAGMGEHEAADLLERCPRGMERYFLEDPGAGWVTGDRLVLDEGHGVIRWGWPGGSPASVSPNLTVESDGHGDLRCLYIKVDKFL